MRRIIFAALMMICSASWAAWEFSTAADNFAEYYDKSTIKKKGAITKMWIMRDYLTEQNFSENKTYKSSKQLYAFDCKEDKLAGISISRYSGSQGEGSVVLTYTRKESELEWHPIVPGSTDAINLKIACRKR
jgi:hypothetical protein